MFKYFHQHYKKYNVRNSNTEVPDPIPFVKPELIHLFFAIFGGIFIFLMCKLDTSVLPNLLATTFILSVIWGAHHEFKIINVVYTDFLFCPKSSYFYLLHPIFDEG